MKVDFWQLSRDPVEKVVSLIAQRVIDQGERLLVVSESLDQRSAISQGLWKAGPDSFLANGEASGPKPEAQPILLSDTLEPVNGANHIIFADGTYRDHEGFDRAFLLFDDTTRDHAAEAWTALKGSETLERAFYRQDGGKWVKVA
ncbi:MAG: DNA polymerase III subunit chi [Pseudomonadota bacterium]